MKIIYHHRTLGDGAEGIHIKEMINAFRGLGHTVRVVSPIGKETNSKGSKARWLKKFKAYFPGFLYDCAEIGYNLYGYAFLRKVCKTFQPDFIYDRYITFNGSSILVGRQLNIPIILEVNAPLALERTQQKDENLFFIRTATRFEKWICSNSTRTIVVSTPLGKYLSRLGVPNEKISVMPNGVNLKLFDMSAKKDKELLRLQRIKDTAYVVGFVGILRPWHGIHILINAFKKILEVRDDLHLLLVGDGPIKNEIIAIVERFNLNKKVSITGRVPHDEIPHYINLFDIAVSPKTTFYASPMKIIEYMAMGKAVIAPNTENIRDIIDDDRNGILFKPDDVESLAKSIHSLISNKEKSSLISENARLKTEKELNWSNNANKVIRMVLNEMLG